MYVDNACTPQVIFATIGGLGTPSFEDFVEFAGTMPHPYIQDFLKGCDPVSEPVSYSRTVRDAL